MHIGQSLCEYVLSTRRDYSFNDLNDIQSDLFWCVVIYASSSANTWMQQRLNRGHMYIITRRLVCVPALMLSLTVYQLLDVLLSIAMH